MADKLSVSDSSDSEGRSSLFSGSSSSDSSNSDSSGSDSDEDEAEVVGVVPNQPAMEEANAAELSLSLEQGAGTGTGDTVESDDERSVVTHEPIFNLYPKVEDDTVMSDEEYKGHEYPIVSNCRRELYAKCPDMKTSFGKFPVSNRLFWFYNLY